MNQTLLWRSVQYSIQTHMWHGNQDSVCNLWLHQMGKNAWHLLSFSLKMLRISFDFGFLQSAPLLFIWMNTATFWSFDRSKSWFLLQRRPSYLACRRGSASSFLLQLQLIKSQLCERDNSDDAWLKDAKVMFDLRRKQDIRMLNIHV